MYESRQVEGPYGFALFEDDEQVSQAFWWPESAEILRCSAEGNVDSDEYQFWNRKLHERLKVWHEFWKLRGQEKPKLGMNYPCLGRVL